MESKVGSMSKDPFEIAAAVQHLNRALANLGGNPAISINVDFKTLTILRDLPEANKGWFREDRASRSGVIQLAGVLFDSGPEARG